MKIYTLIFLFILGACNIDSRNPNISFETIPKKAKIGYIPENVNLYPYLSGIENLDYFCKISGRSLSEVELGQLLSECSLDSDAHHKSMETYSKGMRQKVGIAIALAKKAKV